MNRKILLFGCGGHSRSVTDVLLANDPEISVCYVDDNAGDNETLYGFRIVKECPDTEELDYFFAIGDNFKRRRKYEEIGDRRLISIMSKTAHLGHESQIGKGAFLGNFTHIGPEAVVGVNTIINTGAIVEHEVKVGDHCHIGPNATVSGRCRIGDLVFVGVGARIKDYISICDNVIIGAGATVVKDIIDSGVYVGTPARRIK